MALGLISVQLHQADACVQLHAIAADCPHLGFCMLGGEWISTIEIENLAMGHKDVAEAAVVAIPNKK